MNDTVKKNKKIYKLAKDRSPSKRLNIDDIKRAARSLGYKVVKNPHKD
tara:strand:+ start:1342 stop:1485 length:144 start_codon:yes stop_codon:yes gene_type:complete